MPEELDFDELSEEDWAALDRANDAVGQEENDPDSLGSLPDRTDAAADILGGLCGDQALEALGGKPDEQG